MTTALSPERRILIPMICSAANQNAGRIISDTRASTVRSPSCSSASPARGEAVGSLLVYRAKREVPVAKARRNAVLWALSDHLVLREKLGNFPLRGVRRVGTMDRIFADRFCVRLANGSRGGLGRVGSAHDLTVFRDGIFSFQHLHHDGSGYHKLDKLTKERTLAMHGIEFLRLLAGNAHALLRDDTQACLLDDRIDGAGQIAPGRVGFQDRKSALNRHRIFLHWRTIEQCIGELVPRGLYRQAFQEARSVASHKDFIGGERYAGPLPYVCRL